MATRILLLIATNFAVIVVLGIVAQLFGLDKILAQNGMSGQMTGLFIMSLIIGFGGSFISLAMSKWLAKRSMGVQLIEQPANNTEQWLISTVRRQAEQANISMPEVGIFNTSEVNAFATGMRRNNALVAVSSGLLNAMSRDEAEAVMAHEISHVANGDMVTMGLIQGVLNTFVIFLSRVVGMVVDKAVFKTRDGFGPGYFIVSIIAQILLGILASIIASWYSRRREYRADAGGAELAGREKMAAALERLKMQHEPEELPGQLAAFGISGGVKGGLRKLLSTHPPLEDRIAALRNI
ncbi:MAG: protease HtpX [Gammaproteobacteria bacterium]